MLPCLIIYGGTEVKSEGKKYLNISVDFTSVDSSNPRSENNRKKKNYRKFQKAKFVFVVCQATIYIAFTFVFTTICITFTLY